MKWSPWGSQQVFVDDDGRIVARVSHGFTSERMWSAFVGKAELGDFVSEDHAKAAARDYFAHRERVSREITRQFEMQREIHEKCFGKPSELTPRITSVVRFHPAVTVITAAVAFVLGWLIR